MLGKSNLKDLVDDLSSWGKRAVKRIQKLTRKHGILCSSLTYSDGKRG